MTSVVLCVAALTTATAFAAVGMTRSQYIGKLRAANVASSKADDAAMAALQSKTATAAQVKAKLLAMGKTHVKVAQEFLALTPPAAAAKANADFAHAEMVFGRQNEAIARKLPGTKPAIVKYLQTLKPPSGGKLLDRAIAELHAAGFKI